MTTEKHDEKTDLKYCEQKIHDRSKISVLPESIMPRSLMSEKLIEVVDNAIVLEHTVENHYDTEGYLNIQNIKIFGKVVDQDIFEFKTDVNQVYDNGQIRSQIIYLNRIYVSENKTISSEDRKLWYSCGNLDIHNVCVNNKLNGVCKKYHSNGKLYIYRTFSDGLLNGIYKELDEFGGSVNEWVYRNGVRVS